MHTSNQMLQVCSKRLALYPFRGNFRIMARYFKRRCAQTMARIGIWLLAASFLAACSTSMHTPEPVPVAETMSLNEFQTDVSVSLINSASDEDKKKWTEAAIALLSEQLEQRGAEVTEDAPLHINLEIVRVTRVTVASWLTLASPEGCEVVMQVESGDGYVNNYSVNAAAYFWQKACDKGVTSAVVNLLNDPKVRAYLQFSKN